MLSQQRLADYARIAWENALKDLKREAHYDDVLVKFDVTWMATTSNLKITGNNCAPNVGLVAHAQVNIHRASDFVVPITPTYKGSPVRFWEPCVYISVGNDTKSCFKDMEFYNGIVKGAVKRQLLAYITMSWEKSRLGP